MAVSFIGGGNQRTRRKPPTCRKSLTTLSHNVVHLALYHGENKLTFDEMMMSALYLTNTLR